jgi:AcrR family transcriptional regulator
MPRINSRTAAPGTESADPVAAGAPKGTLNDRRWLEILDAATDTFDEKGYQAATLQDVASRVSLLAPSLYYYIKTKEDLLFAVMQRAHLLGLRLLDEAPDLRGADAETRLVAFIHRWMGGTYPPEVRIIERDLRFLSAARQAEVLGWRDRMDHFVADIVRQGVEEGAFDSDLEPSVVASTLFVVLNSTPTWFRVSGRRSYDELREWYARLFVRGLRAEPG